VIDADETLESTAGSRCEAERGLAITSRFAAEAVRVRAATAPQFPCSGATRRSARHACAPRPAARSSFQGFVDSVVPRRRPARDSDLPSRRPILERRLRDEPNKTRATSSISRRPIPHTALRSALHYYKRRVEMGRQMRGLVLTVSNRSVGGGEAEPWQEAMELPHRVRVHARPGRPLFTHRHELPSKALTTPRISFARAMKIPHPANDRLFVERHLYEYLRRSNMLSPATTWRMRHGDRDL